MAARTVTGEASCQYLEWDSAFFDRRIARVIANRLTRDAVRDILTWCRDHSIDCLYFLADPADPETVRVAEESQFRLVDVRVTLQTSLGSFRDESNHPSDVVIRPSRTDDIADLRRIAATNHTDSRFYADCRFPRSKCDELYATWIEKSCLGYADTVLVPEVAGCAAGYVSCHLVDESSGRIGLFGVAPEHQGRGLAGGLLRCSLRWFADRGLTRVRVVTQARNCPAQRVYQRGGFLTDSVHLWYHRWLS